MSRISRGSMDKTISKKHDMFCNWWSFLTTWSQQQLDTNTSRKSAVLGGNIRTGSMIIRHGARISSAEQVVLLASWSNPKRMITKLLHNSCKETRYRSPFKWTITYRCIQSFYYNMTSVETLLGVSELSEVGSFLLYKYELLMYDQKRIWIFV